MSPGGDSSGLRQSARIGPAGRPGRGGNADFYYVTIQAATLSRRSRVNHS